MKRITGMLMIGSAVRKAGKTTLVCELLKQFSSQQKIVAVKVIPFDNTGSRPQHGSNMPPPLTGGFEITEQTNPSGGNDTSRMLAAGAERALELKLIKSALPEAGDALQNILGSDTACIVESNCMRQVLAPDLFVMLTAESEHIKESYRQLKQYADILAAFDANRFDPPIDRESLNLHNGRWTCKFPATAIILAGGGSRRMGLDKRMLDISGKPMIRHVHESLAPHFDEILISANNLNINTIPDQRIIEDEHPERGPLMGVASAMSVSRNDTNFITACDIPEMNIDLVRKMLRLSRDCDGVVPRTERGHMEPLFAVYRKSTLSIMKALLDNGKHRIIGVYDKCNIKYLDLAPDEMLQNINTMQEYRTYIDTQKNQNKTEI